MSLLRRFRPLLVVLASVFVAMQLVPYGWTRSNPPVLRDAPWPDDSARAIAVASCYDCHSNEVDYPVWAYVAPSSWLVRRDVEQARDELNFSDWDRYGGEADDAIEMIGEGEMPPSRYTALHPGARLTDEEKTELVAALAAMDAED